MSIRSYFMAKFYDATMKKMEASCFSDWRTELLSDIDGDVLEIGSGTGINLAHYPDAIQSLVLTEPDSHMLRILNNNISEIDNEKISTEMIAADKLGFADNSFDSVVSTLVLCSVPSPERTLEEIRRVLKPGGKLYFMEHVIAADTPHIIKWQKMLQPFWVCMCGNCHLTRDTETYMRNAGFDFDKIDRLRSTGGPPIVAPTIKGVARNVITEQD